MPTPAKGFAFDAPQSKRGGIHERNQGHSKHGHCRSFHMQQIDMMIAAIALSLGQCTIVTTDTDLAAVPGLAVENWIATRP
jgi:predicted nucleic acid-binding protein